MEVMPLGESVGDCGQDRAKDSIRTRTDNPRPFRDDHSGRDSDHSAIDAINAEKIARFAAENWDRVVGIVGSVCGPGVDASGAVAEALARFLEALARGKSVQHVMPWVTQVAINVGRSELRHSWVRWRNLPGLVSSETSVDSSEVVTESLDLQRAIAGLPKRQAQVVALRYGLDMSIVDIAEALGLSEGGTKASLSKARRNLARALTIDEGAENE
jgi:RNA polymerase sigma factor (sigma-70 family)